MADVDYLALSLTDLLTVFNEGLAEDPQDPVKLEAIRAAVGVKYSGLVLKGFLGRTYTDEEDTFVRSITTTYTKSIAVGFSKSMFKK